MHSPSKIKLGRQVKIEEGWMLQKRSVLYGPLGISTGCANFLEDVKVHLGVQPQNAQSQKNEFGSQVKIEEG
jgi:hypothetical protein